ncbi:MAG: RHS repeat-associated core domain-containing protein [Candidatus Acidiferrales bacterium]
MQLSSGSQIPDGLLAAMSQLAENSRQGVPSKNPALHQGIDAPKMQNAMEFQSFVSTTRIGSRCTGKERDSESGLDYFGARYYASSMGRFMSPDWSAKQEPVPYSKLDDPQTLNLYSYVGNNPLSRADKDGHCFPFCLALAGGGVLAEEAPLAFTGPVGWTVIGVTAVGVAGVAAYQYFHQDAPAAPSSPAPATGATPVPTGLVGTDPTPTKGRTNSGPLAPENGGTGDAGKDFGTLTGGKSGPAPEGKGYPAGTQIGENGTQLRPGSSTSGPRIDIPANGGKPIETLHYPAPPPPPPPPPKPVTP